jgi:hypothetical protein
MSSAEEGKEYLKARGREARETMGQWVDKGKEAVGRQKEQFSQAAEKIQQAYREASEGKKS